MKSRIKITDYRNRKETKEKLEIDFEQNVRGITQQLKLKDPAIYCEFVPDGGGYAVDVYPVTSYAIRREIERKRFRWIPWKKGKNLAEISILPDLNKIICKIDDMSVYNVIRKNIKKLCNKYNPKVEIYLR